MNKKNFLSIILITKNEEENLDKLLESLGKIPDNVEIIVSDAQSTDKTVEIAMSYGCLIATGGMPSVGRNNGAKLASGKYLYFSDADNIFPKNYILNLEKKITERQIEVGSTAVNIQIKKLINLFDYCFMNITNVYNFLFQKINHGGYGPSMICRKDIFDEIIGFDPSLKVFEDVDFLKRASINHKFSFLLSPKPYFSIRRFEKDGRLKTTLRYLYWPLHDMLFKNKKMPSFFDDYKFDHYKENLKDRK